MIDIPKKNSMYDPRFEKDSCGFGLIAQMDDKPSHELIKTAIKALTRLTHRGAVAADGKTGDGCGLLIKKPDSFFKLIAKQENFDLCKLYAVGMVFLNAEEKIAQHQEKYFKQKIKEEGLNFVGWRVVPINSKACGESALQTLPCPKQLFINAPNDMDEKTFEAKLFLIRRRVEIHFSKKDEIFYVPSLSSRVISYKGLIMPEYLPTFYEDLNDETLASSVCVFHQRFSTNTLPQWDLAQPFRFLAHNGEINTVCGNRNWAEARASTFHTDHIPGLSELKPLVSMTGSDSCSLDNMLEILSIGGMDLFRAMKLLIPPAWKNNKNLDTETRAFYEYNSMHMEPWDGPAGIVLTDGRYAACVMDRNGLRPARYVITDDRCITLASEIGVYDYLPKNVVAKGRLGPGEMVAVDTKTGKLLMSDDIDQELKSRQKYAEWMQKAIHIDSLQDQDINKNPMDNQTLKQYEKMFDITFEERDQVLRVLAEAGQEAVGSMGDDTPLPVFSRQVRSLFDYFRQQFAQVTNPPIDSLREQIVMSLETCLGPEKNMFEETAEHAKRLIVDSPILTSAMFKKLVETLDEDYKHVVIELNYPKTMDLENAIKDICKRAIRAVKEGAVLIVLSDKNINPEAIPVHSALATGAVHHSLIKEGLRCKANIVLETGVARDPHHMAVLIGFGATAIYPFLAYESLIGMQNSGEIPTEHNQKLLKNYRNGINKGLYKIMSKMGISTIASYRGAQLFEIVGLHHNIVDLCFKGGINRIEGSNFIDIQKDQEILANEVWRLSPTKQGGLLKYIHGGEYHAFNPDVVQALQLAAKTGDIKDYEKYTDLVNRRPPIVIRDLLKLKENTTQISIDEVESIGNIIKRFDTAGMSLGALSPDAHETLAQAMNNLGGRSNSGEGGEDPKRFATNKNSKIKQVASGRFGVTPHYLVNAEVLQIKIAQGAKPGEGGQLPGKKVNKMIAELRYSVPGVTLISPPPHHDIYSIEDLAQLIFDLKQVNPEAKVSVKLVAEAGVGTIAAGVAKAYADLITISGYDGGTGASPITSIKYAGSPWELGITETHLALRANDLREKVRLQADGGLKTGLDVIKAAILGAESFGFGTAPMIAMGCKYLRICHLNNCATGVATQDNILRKHHFIGEDIMVMNFFKLVAEETRSYLAQLGAKKLTDIIGQTDLLEIIEGDTEKQHKLDLRPLLSNGGIPDNKPQFCTHKKNQPFDKGKLAEKMVSDMSEAIKNKSEGEYIYKINNTNRSIGARISGVIAKQHGNYGMSKNPLRVQFSGTAGQSFGAWNAGGLHMYLEGDANDYVGKGMAAGKLVIYPPKDSRYKSNETIIIGNTCLYGATGGRIFAAGGAGERFGVRNSGAIAVVEGVGDHACEYMTGGAAVILGQTGFNFGAGMTGGFAIVLDEKNCFEEKYNPELVEVQRIKLASMEKHANYLRSLLMQHAGETGSEWGQHILEHFNELLESFWLVKPKASKLETLIENLRQAA
jgi:glutamate synthase (NADPH/NADH) large chain